MLLVVVVCISLAKELKASWKSIVAAASAPPPEGQSHIYYIYVLYISSPHHLITKVSASLIIMHSVL
jgi:hypothetical protein